MVIRFAAAKLAAALSVVLLVMPLAEAQRAGKVYRIGVLFEWGPLSAMAGIEPKHPHLRPFLQRLQELGYTEGQNLIVERRAAEGHPERLPALAAELAGLNLDLIVAGPVLPPWEVRQATSSIPIVAPAMDPVASLGVQSLARPGDNLTGLQQMVDWNLEGKRLELLKLAVPTASRVAVLRQAGIRPDAARVADQQEQAARALGLTLVPVVIQRAEQLKDVFVTIAQQRVDGIYVPVGTITWGHRREVADRAAKARLPAMYALEENVEAGGLMAYSVDVVDLFRRAAEYVDKILRGARPADLPIEQPRKFRLVINMTTAKALGLAIPPVLQLQADRIIE